MVAYGSSHQPRTHSEPGFALQRIGLQGIGLHSIAKDGFALQYLMTVRLWGVGSAERLQSLCRSVTFYYSYQSHGCKLEGLFVSQSAVRATQLVAVARVDS